MAETILSGHKKLIGLFPHFYAPCSLISSIVAYDFLSKVSYFSAESTLTCALRQIKVLSRNKSDIICGGS